MPISQYHDVMYGEDRANDTISVVNRSANQIKRLCMRRSKLETYVDILEVLVHWGPLKLTHVMSKSNVNYRVLEQYFSFLIKQGLVNERILRKDRKVYAITPNGVEVVKKLRELKVALPILEGTSNKSKNHRPQPF